MHVGKVYIACNLRSVEYTTSVYLLEPSGYSILIGNGILFT